MSILLRHPELISGSHLAWQIIFKTNFDATLKQVQRDENRK